MPAKNLYEILEVARNATAEVVDASYRLQCERVKALALKDVQAAAISRQALDEAYKTLTSPQLRARYDAKLALFSSPAVAPIEDDSWFTRNRSWLIALLLLVGGITYFAVKARNEKLEAQRQLADKQAALERERADREAEQAKRDAAAAAMRVKQQEAQYQIWQQQVRAQASARQQAETRAANQRERQWEREKQLEVRRQEAEQLRRENEARMNLEREKQKLRALECARGPC